MKPLSSGATTSRVERTTNSRRVRFAVTGSYNRLVGKLQQFAKKLAELPSDDEFRIQTTEKLLKKLFDMGLLPTESSLAAVETIPASAFCRWVERRGWDV